MRSFTLCLAAAVTFVGVSVGVSADGPLYVKVCRYVQVAPRSCQTRVERIRMFLTYFPNLEPEFPQCDPDGNYAPQQRRAATGERWCVEPYSGAEVPGTRTAADQDPAQCEELSSSTIYG